MDERSIEVKHLTSRVEQLQHELDERGVEVEYLTSRVEQLQHERAELQKDIEQLCLQQAGPGYLAAATRMHFQRTAGLEQEIEGLRKKLAVCTREKHNLQEELSEAYRIKSQLADLHSAEVLKNKEAEKQLKFFQSCVAAAFSERDHALMESERVKERQHSASERLTIAENRVEELQSTCNDEKQRNANLRMEIRQLKDQNETFEKVVNKFYEILEKETGSSGDHTWQGKCSRLLDDPADSWIYNSDSKASTSKYIASLEEELEKRKNSIDNLQSNLRMGLQIERHMKKNVQFLERKQNILVSTVKNGLSALHDFYNQQRSEVMKILEEETSKMKLVLVEIQEKLNQIQIKSKLQCETTERGRHCVDDECKDVHITGDLCSGASAESCIATGCIPLDGPHNASDTLAQALQEKVAALLLLSQQEERHLLERDVYQALENKMEELQRNLCQVTNEKVQALMELAQLKQDYQLLHERSRGQVSKHKKFMGDASEKGIIVHEQEGKLKNILKRSYMKWWIGKGLNEQEIDVHGSTDESSTTSKRNIYPADLARLKVENAALQESMANLEELTSSIHRLHATLLKAREDAIAAGPMKSVTEALKSIIAQANKVKTVLGSSLPVSWSTDAAVDAATYENLYEPTEDKVDPVSSAGLEMVALLILASQLLQENLAKSTTN
ncbi:myosin-2 heavy chain isoform X2 [Asparagus officinalis]|uniref:myosin-2 heavy chain isoform X2 n=1 Tax=Asparagus officinalis TaxID=4686 RepID=UPI00098DF8BE|nr:myosin-2 heavy chain isoform X2 [Asparagus officinalis]